MAKPKSKPQLGLHSAHISDTAAGIPDDHWCWPFFQHIYCCFDDAQFADLYEEGGRYPISPALLGCLTILQYMFRVRERAGVESTVMRRDWRIALGRTGSVVRPLLKTKNDALGRCLCKPGRSMGSPAFAKATAGKLRLRGSPCCSEPSYEREAFHD